MGSDDNCSSYEARRNKNVERNQNVMRMLGLLEPRSVHKEEHQSSQKSRRCRGSDDQTSERRQSDRIASLAKSSIVCTEINKIATPISSRKRTNKKGPGQSVLLQKKVLTGNKEMDTDKNLEEAYSTDSSSEGLYAVEVNMNSSVQKSVLENALSTSNPSDMLANTSSAVNLDSENLDFEKIFGNHLQEFLMRALKQSATSLLQPSTSQTTVSADGPAESAQGNGDEVIGAKTWSQRTYNVVKARQTRKPQMSRTSVGEGSDSQREFGVPENETSKERSVRTRRLNRHRGKRSKELTNNRKALKKLPYVIHVDGMAKARGIHKHLWRIAVRGQCGRLDPTMDNINHHPKQVVDGIWHGLEKEWEFEGFAHRAREMFERSATKFMRNRKMQLKYKCQKIVDDSKPNDVVGSHWSKIVDVTNKLTKPIASKGLVYNTAKGKEVSVVADQENMEAQPTQRILCMEASGNASQHYEVEVGLVRKMDRTVTMEECAVCVIIICYENNDEQPQKGSCSSPSRINEPVLGESQDVDARIRILQSELFQLQQSRKIDFRATAKKGFHSVPFTDNHYDMTSPKEGAYKMKENVVPLNWNSDHQEVERIEKKATQRPTEVHDRVLCESTQNKSCERVHVESQNIGQGVADNFHEMDCGDIVNVYAFTGGQKEEIGRGIIMGLADSKYARKVIPKGWRSIKFASYTSSGASKICPFPAGWSEQSKNQTVKEASGRCILWPDMLLVSLLHL